MFTVLSNLQRIAKPRAKSKKMLKVVSAEESRDRRDTRGKEMERRERRGSKAEEEGAREKKRRQRGEENTGQN